MTALTSAKTTQWEGANLFMLNILSSIQSYVLAEQNFVDRQTDKTVDFNKTETVFINRQNKNSTCNKYSRSLDP
jgi:hypothetical protein